MTERSGQSAQPGLPTLPAMETNTDNAAVNAGALKALRMFSLVEGVSTLLLFFVAMPLKYAAGMPMAVTVMGALHGILFTLLVIAFGVGYKLVPLPGRLTCLGIGAAIVPFGPFWLEPKLKALGRAT